MPLAPIAVLLIGLLSSVIVRLFLTLGIGFFTYTQLTTYLFGFLDNLTSSVDAISADLYQILAMFGLWEGLSIIAGAMIGIAAVKAARVFLGILPGD